MVDHELDVRRVSRIAPPGHPHALQSEKPEPRDFEMAVVGEGHLDPPALHHFEAHGIRESKLLIPKALEPGTMRGPYKAHRNVEPLVNGIVQKGTNHDTRAAFVGSVQEMGVQLRKHQRCSDEPLSLFDDPVCSLDGAIVILVAPVCECEQCARVD